MTTTNASTITLTSEVADEFKDLLSRGELGSARRLVSWQVFSDTYKEFLAAMSAGGAVLIDAALLERAILVVKSSSHKLYPLTAEKNRGYNYGVRARALVAALENARLPD